MQHWFIAFVMAVGSVPILGAATVQPLDGPPISGGSLSWAAGAVQLDGRSIPLAEVDWIELQPGQPTAVTTRVGLWLADGGWLPATAISAGAGDAIRATTPLGPVELPLTALLGWAPGELPAAVAGKDRVQVAAGLLDGRVQGIRDGRLLFASLLDDQPLPLAIGDVTALRLDLPTAPATGLLLTARFAPDRPPVRLEPSPAGLALAGQRGADLSLDALAGQRLQVDGPGSRRVWLSDLAPASVNETGAFGTVWPWQRDRDLDGGPLRLAGQRVAKGICVHAASTLSWALHGAYSRFQAQAGIADLVRPEGDCLATLTLDGRQLWQRRLRGTEPAVPITAELTGGRILTLTIELGERYDIGDHVVLADAWLARVP